MSQVEASRGETVLVVEDERAILDLIERLLAALGYTTLAAGRPSEAIRLVQDYPDRVDLLISDVMMPEMSGSDLYKVLALLKPGLRCLYISGYSEEIVAAHGILEEEARFLQKPFTLRDLGVEVRRALERRPALLPSAPAP